MNSPHLQAAQHFRAVLSEEYDRMAPTRRTGLVQRSTGDTRAYNMARFQCYMEVYEKGFRWKLERFQREFGMVQLETLAHHLLDNDFHVLAPSVCKALGWTSMSRLGVAMTARRMGKSVAVAKSLVALVEALIRYPLASGEPFNISVYSPGKRQSQSLALYFKDFANERALREHLSVDNAETMEFKGDKSDYSCPPVRVHFYPSNPKVQSTISQVYCHIKAKNPLSTNPQVVAKPWGSS